MRVRTPHHHLYGQRIGSSVGSVVVDAEGIAHGLSPAQVAHFGRLGWEVLPEPEPEPEPAPKLEPMPVPAPEPRPTPMLEPEPAPKLEPMPVPAPEPRPTPMLEPEPAPAPVPEPNPVPEPARAPVPEPVPVPPAEAAPVADLDRAALVARAKELGLKVGAHKAATIAEMVANAEAEAASLAQVGGE